jgi:NAD(P)-dependent dehydrogenase (short-subunit alcohol dehydrogenase family)
MLNSIVRLFCFAKVNNAAAFWFGKFEDVTSDIWMHVLKTNVIGYSNNIQAALPHFKQNGKGVVVNIASVSSCMFCHLCCPPNLAC